MHTTKDLANLLQLMQTSRQSGDLIVEPQIQGEVPWLGLFRLVDGQVTICQVRRKADGRVMLEYNEALRWLLNPQQGKLEWSLQESAPLPQTFLPLHSDNDDTTGDVRRNRNTGSSLPSVQYNGSKHMHPAPPYNVQRALPRPASDYERLKAVPRRVEQGNYTAGSTLSSRDHRQVFLLVDGHRTVEEIAQLLHKQPDLVVRVVNELQAMGQVE